MIEIAIISFIALMIGIFSMWLYTRDTYIVRVKKGIVIDFKSIMELTGVPMITFYQKDKKYNFIVDTGSNVSYINGASGIEYTPIGNSKETFIGAGGTSNSECTMGLVSLSRNGDNFDFNARVADLEASFIDFQQTFGVKAHGLLGNDILRNKHYCIDFKECVIYERK